MAKSIIQSNNPTKAIIRAIAVDIGKDAVHHLEIMYPSAFAALPASGKTSLRNCIHNQIMAAIEVTDEGQIIARLADRKLFRRKQSASYRKMRKGKLYA